MYLALSLSPHALAHPLSGYTPADLEACATEVHRVYRANAAKIIKAVFEKFAADKWHCVALLPVPDAIFGE
jgi:hypothetical protein